MKNFFDVTYKNSSKSVAIFFAFLIIVGLIAALIGCGDDNLTNNNGNPPSNEQLIVSMDSISFRSILPGYNDTILLASLNNIDSGKITFELQSNFPTEVTITASIKSISTDTTANETIWGLQIGQNTNENFTIGFKPNKLHDRLRIATGFILHGVPVFTFVIIKNFKLFKIN